MSSVTSVSAEGANAGKKEKYTRYNGIDDYIKSFLKNKDKDNTERLRKFIEKIESEFKNKIIITYAPSRINIANPKSKIKRKVFVYINVMKDKIRLDITDKDHTIIELFNTNEIENEKDDYINVLKKAFESLEN
jgi:hypothetical protein